MTKWKSAEQKPALNIDWLIEAEQIKLFYETSMIAANATEFTSSAKPNTHEQNHGGSIRPLKIKFCTDEKYLKNI